MGRGRRRQPVVEVVAQDGEHPVEEAFPEFDTEEVDQTQRMAEPGSVAGGACLGPGGSVTLLTLPLQRTGAGRKQTHPPGSRSWSEGDIGSRGGQAPQQARVPRGYGCRGSECGRVGSHGRVRSDRGRWADGRGGVTVKHVFGETRIPAPPTRVVSAGLTEQDDLRPSGPTDRRDELVRRPAVRRLAVAQPQLGSAHPVVLNLDNGIQVDRIAQLKPDLIVAINAGLDSAIYEKLTAIAPTIAQADGDAFFEPWKEQAAAVGAATFHSDQMARSIRDVDEKFSAAAQANPQFKNRTAVLLAGRFAGDTIAATAGGWRTDFLTAMGFQIPTASRRSPTGTVGLRFPAPIWPPRCVAPMY